MFFNKLNNHPILTNICKQTCQENSSVVGISDSLLKNGMLDENKILIIKPDLYYHSTIMHNPPQAIDCMIFVRCSSGLYSVYLVELRTCTGTSRISLSEILPKFKTISDDFIVKFSDIFNELEGKIKSVELWLVVDPFRTSRMSADNLSKKILGTVVEQYSLMKPISIFGKSVIIKPKLPYEGNPFPTINAC